MELEKQESGEVWMRMSKRLCAAGGELGENLVTVPFASLACRGGFIDTTRQSLRSYSTVLSIVRRVSPSAKLGSDG